MNDVQTDGPNENPGGDAETVRREPVDLDAIEADLTGVEAALGRLDDGTYWSDEVTGEPLSDELLADDPVARRSP